MRPDTEGGYDLLGRYRGTIPFLILMYRKHIMQMELISAILGAETPGRAQALLM
jgi:hypothetical protein